MKNRVEDICDELDKIFNPLISKCCGRKSCNNCCQGCAVWNAHFRYEPIIDQPGNLQMAIDFRKNEQSAGQLNALKQKYGWDELTGFLIPFKGCRLPRSERSAYCQLMVCHVMKPYNPDVVQIMRLIDELRDIRKKDGKIF